MTREEKQKAIDALKTSAPVMPVTQEEFMDYVQTLNKIMDWLEQEPKTGHCNDCRWWKDSDGVYRRGIGAESSCPFNTKETYDGNAYCYRFEPQERCDKE